MLDTNFFQQDTALVAEKLVGCFLVCNQGNEKYSYQITETEAYLGPEDTASHARFGRTKRSEIMYGPPGRLYVYLIYGLHNMLNIVTEPEGRAGAVLIRSIETADGPGKLTQKLKITKGKHNGILLGEKNRIWIEERPENFESSSIETASRIGINYAEAEWRDKKLRFFSHNVK